MRHLVPPMTVRFVCKLGRCQLLPRRRVALGPGAWGRICEAVKTGRRSPPTQGSPAQQHSKLHSTRRTTLSEHPRISPPSPATTAVENSRALPDLPTLSAYLLYPWPTTPAQRRPMAATPSPRRSPSGSVPTGKEAPARQDLFGACS